LLDSKLSILSLDSFFLSKLLKKQKQIHKKSGLLIFIHELLRIIAICNMDCWLKNRLEGFNFASWEIN